MFALLHLKSFLKNDLLKKKRTCSAWEQILSFNSRPVSDGSKYNCNKVVSFERVSILLNEMLILLKSKSTHIDIHLNGTHILNYHKLCEPRRMQRTLCASLTAKAQMY